MEDLLATANYVPLTAIIIEETHGIDRMNEPVTVGIPFPKGLLYQSSKLVLHDARYALVPLQTRELAKWPDNSLKWVLLDFQASVEAKSIREFELIKDESGTVSGRKSYISVEENQNYFFIDTKAASFFVNTGIFKPFDRVVVDGKEILDIQKSKAVLKDEAGTVYEPIIEGMSRETQGPLRITLKAEGRFKSQSGSEFASFSARLSFFANSPLVRIEFTLLNPRAAKHPGGLWDLGDPGSVFFKDFSLHAALNTYQQPTEISWTTRRGAYNSQRMSRKLLIYQDSSGGKNWNSRNHMNRDREIKNAFRGYQVYSDGELVEKGMRTHPCIAVADKDKKISAAVQSFWQNFPKALEADDDTLIIRLFPKQYNDIFELQGGEQKTHTVFLHFGETQDFTCLEGLIHAPLILRVSPEWYAKSKGFDYLVPESSDPNKKLTEVINTAIRGKHTFFHRREIIDEYGWRNFGDLYADHEAVGYQGDPPLISHYNNQYDCIYGMLTRFARSGDFRWFLLADQLCSHVKDIDIYHTDEDRPEYNHGLLWHTEHYLDVQTATHRCFSKRHSEYRNLDAYGGGPSLSHIYSAGLVFHYYMTGSLSSKEAALELAGFVIQNMDMDNTLLSHVLRGLRKTKTSLKDKLGKGDLVDFAKVYELEGPGRATGNCLNILINAYLLTDDAVYLEKADELICGCIHPDDDIEQRELSEDVENRWMYTVFLQAIGRYLDMKTERHQFDAMWHYARQCLIRYADWMTENESPYLEKPEKLEYPNETWAAQEVRKCNVFLYAARYAEKNLRQRFLKKAEFFYKEAMKYFFSYETVTLTRPIALMMLNGMMYSHAKINGMPSAVPSDISEPASYDVKKGNLRRAFYLKREMAFLKWRI